MSGAALMSCVAFDFTVPSTVEDLNERPSVAILPVGFDLEIRTRSAVKTAHEMLSLRRNQNRWPKPCGTYCQPLRSKVNQDFFYQGSLPTFSIALFQQSYSTVFADRTRTPLRIWSKKNPHDEIYDVHQ